MAIERVAAAIDRMNKTVQQLHNDLNRIEAALKGVLPPKATSAKSAETRTPR